MNIPIGPTLQMVLVLGFVIAVAFVAVAVFRRNARSGSSGNMDFSMFSSSELEKLKGKGLLTEDEAKKVRSIVAERSLEAMERAKQPPEEAPPDLNTLLAEADRYRREYSKNSESPNEESE